MYARRDLADDFRALGVRPGDVVMLHASVRAVGAVAGGPDQIHLALKDALTPEGTLLMYASCPAHYDEVGRGDLSPDEERDILDKLPAFDARTARSQRDNGALVECLRTWPDSSVNDHVARFVAWGRHVDQLFAEQPWDFAFGAGSALDVFGRLGGRILLLGADHDTVTFLHHVEHVADLPGRRIARFRVPVHEHGRRVWREMAEVDTSGRGAHPHWPDRFFARVVDTHLAQTGNAGGRVGDAESYLMEAVDLAAFAQPVMERLARDRDAATGLAERGPRPVSL